MTFPGLLNFYPLKLLWGGVGKICLGSNDSRINPHMRAKFGCSQTVVSKKGGVQTDTHTHTHTHTQSDTAALYSRLAGYPASLGPPPTGGLILLSICRQIMKFPGALDCFTLKTSPPPPSLWGGGVNIVLLIFWAAQDISRTFVEFLTP